MRIDLIEKVEGEVEVQYFFKNRKIDFVNIIFPHYRGIEEILKDRPIWDALAINPRVCGICGHAHLFATVRAIENIYKNSGVEVKISKKARKIREITLFCEIIQNHLKWLYLVIFPIMNKISKLNVNFLEIHKAIVNINRVSSIFSGQWPHSSYMVPGGVVCDPTYLEILQAKSNLEEAFFIVNRKIFKDLDLNMSFNDLKSSRSGLGLIYKFLKENSLLSVGKAYDRYIIFGEHSFTDRVKILKTISYPIKLKFVEEESQNLSYAKNVTYRQKFYETGPLARMMLLKPQIIKQLHRSYKDSIFTRIIARVIEILYLFNLIKEHLDSIDISEESYISIKKDIKEAFAESAVEAARGSLIHKIWVKNNRIKKYEIITPTQWNLSNGTYKNPSIAQKAIIGTQNKDIAQLIFRSFDICSVCTTH